MRFGFSFIALASALSLMSACRGDPQRPPVSGELPVSPPQGASIAGGGQEAGAHEAGADAGDAGDGGDAGACNDLANDGNAVDQEAVVTDPPAATGGTVVSGDYLLTEARVYVGASGTAGVTGVTVKGALHIGGSSFARVLETSTQGATPQERRTVGTFATTGNGLTMTSTCPVPAQEQMSFSASDTGLVITNLVTKDSFTFTLR